MKTTLPRFGKKVQVEMPQSSKYLRLKKGSFSKVHSVRQDGTLVALEWLYCREYFQDESQGIKRILFCHKECRSKNIAGFLFRVEETLCLSEKSVLGPTQRYNVSWISVSPWWTKTSMRRSLFTIMLRCGQAYDLKSENFDEALLSVTYARNTQYAIRRFLDGYTKYAGNTKGWNNQFKLASDDLVDKLLVKPV